MVIIGEMSDEAFQLATDASAASSSSQFHLDEEPIYDLLPHSSLPVASDKARRVSKPITLAASTGSGSAIDRLRPGRIFVPSARYSMTLHPPHLEEYPDEYKRGGGGLAFDATIHPAISESPVYGYEWKKPHIIQYSRGQYSYGERKAIPALASSSYFHHRRPFSPFSFPSASSSSSSPSSSSFAPSPPYSPLIPSYSLHSGDLHSSPGKYSSRPDKSGELPTGLVSDAREMVN